MIYYGCDYYPEHWSQSRSEALTRSPAPQELTLEGHQVRALLAR